MTPRSDRLTRAGSARRTAFVIATLALLLAGLVTPRRAAAQSLKPEQVNRSIERGIDFLKSRQRADGGWDNYPGNEGGTTALAVIALVSCDVAPDSPEIRKAVRYLTDRRNCPQRNVYVVSLQTMALAAAAPTEQQLMIRDNASWLINGRNDDGTWGYTPRDHARRDNSNTQYALLALQAAREAGVPVPKDFWKGCQRHWVDSQAPVGSWGYKSALGSSGSMTVAGIASLVIAGRELDNVREGTYGRQRVRCNGSREDENVRRGIDWMGRNFSVTTNPYGSDAWLHYYLYGLERAGRLSGRRFMGEHDWYRAGTRFLVSSQGANGAWGGGGIAEAGPICNTAFSLLFLSKGKIPILVNKIQHGRGADWNNAPNDVHNLTNFIGSKWKVKLNWQIVNINANTIGVEDLMQAPIIQFSGHEPLKFTGPQKKMLRQYVEQGGLIVADANCSVGDFDDSFRTLCKELFPEPGQELRKIEEGHGVWSSLFQLQGSNWPLYGIDIGCRTAVFYSPEDLSCGWEHEEDPNSLPALRMGANIVAYAVGPEDLQDKLTERKVVRNAEDQIKANFLQLAKVRHNGDWNPAPGAVRNLMASLRDIIRVDVVQQQRDIDLADPNLGNYPLLYMHGRTRFTVAAKDREFLVDHLKSGGVLFADACCGNEKFDAAFRALCKQLFPDSPLTPIPANHEIFTNEIGYDLGQVEFGQALGNRRGPPQLEGIFIDNRLAVVYSKWDIGCALERQKSTDCRGYTHESALRIATNVVLYALKS
jgi:hypothetical protein